MKIIVCGAGNVGRSIVSYLVLGNNDIVVIDNDQNKLNALTKEFDIQPVLGSASHPEILEKAGAAGTDMLIAVTDTDEVNMVACGVADALFNIPKKIARIDSQDFLSPLWGGLFNDRHIPIDLVISPAFEIAQEIAALIKMPGMTRAATLLHNKATMFAFRCTEHTVCAQMSIRAMETFIPDTALRTLCVIRSGSCFIPDADYKLQKGDMLYVLTAAEKTEAVIRELGLEKSAVEKLVIFGGGDISRYLAAELEKNDNILSCRIIEENPEIARHLAKKLKDTAVINGDMMSDVILEEAGLESCDASLALMPHDRNNLLLSLLAREHQVPLSFSLVNAASYNDFMENISGSILIDGSAVIISSMLQELRKARISDAYSLGHNFGEIWEVTISDDNINVGSKIKEIDLPAGSRIGVIERKGELIFPDSETVLEAGDCLVLYVGAKGVKKAEKLFT